MAHGARRSEAGMGRFISHTNRKSNGLVRNVAALFTLRSSERAPVVWSGHVPSPRNCAELGPRAIKLTQAEPRSRFTVPFGRLAIDGMQAASQQTVADPPDLSWDEIYDIQERRMMRMVICSALSTQPQGVVNGRSDSSRTDAAVARTGYRPLGPI
jgi:hypothetical protein